MAHARKTGTAWDKNREDYAYTRALESTGWAWEYLRRNSEYRDDFRNSGNDLLFVDRLSNGANIYKALTCNTIAKRWGLASFSDPDMTVLTQDLFWLPALARHAATCSLCPASNDARDTFCLERINGRIAVLSLDTSEIVTIRAAQKVVTLEIVQGSALTGNQAVTFTHQGLNTLSRHIESLHLLKQLMANPSRVKTTQASSENKYLSCLIALDGHLEGRTYRDIAVVLYGADRVEQHWTDDTRWMKSKVRRAVERGVALMLGGYRNLL